MIATIDDRGAAADLVVLVAHAREVGAEPRAAFERAARDAVVDGLVLATCHRVEAYLSQADVAELVTMAPSGVRTLRGDEAVTHALQVAVGLDSVVLGEDQVLHQLRAAVTDARGRGLHPVLERLFAEALRAGRLARSWRAGPRRSLADVAVEALDLPSAGPGANVLVVGAGPMGRLAVQALRRSGATVVLHSRTAATADRAAAELGATTVLPPGVRIDGVIVALRGTWTVDDALARRLLADQPPLVDLSVPVAVPAHLARRLTRVLDMDALADIAQQAQPGPDARERARLDALVQRSRSAFHVWVRSEDARAAAHLLADRTEAARRRALEHLWREVPDVDPAVRDAVERMSRQLAGQLLREPFARLGDDRDGDVARSIREVFAL